MRSGIDPASTLIIPSEITQICSEINNIHTPVNFRDLTKNKHMFSMFKSKDLLTFSNCDPFDVPRLYFFVLNQVKQKHHNCLQAFEIAKKEQNRNVTRKLGN